MPTELQMLDFTVDQDEASPFWTCNIQFAHVEDALQLSPNDRLTLNLYGELFEFYVDKIDINKSSVTDIEAVVTGIGLGADLDIPRKEAITKVWDTNELAFDIVNGLLGGRVDSWDLVNWVVPANRLSVENGSRISVAIQVVQAAGGVLESNPNGTFYVRELYPTPPNQYATATLDHSYEELTHIYNVQHSYQNIRYVDWVRIRDVEEPGVSDRVEYEEDANTGLAGILFVYPSPWRDVVLTHTGPVNVTLSKIGVTSRQIVDELVEIYEGEGNTTYPIVSIDSLTWQAVNLLSLYFDPYTNKVTSSHPTEKFSLVKVTYTTKSINYKTKSPIAQDVQFLVVDENAS